MLDDKKIKEIENRVKTYIVTVDDELSKFGKVVSADITKTPELVRHDSEKLAEVIKGLSN